jgi:ribonuclease BN (tRNA processing enzyme)
MKLLAAAGLLAAFATSAAPAAAAQTRVVLLGTGTPNPDPERSGPSVAVVVNGQAYLIDAGPGVMRRAQLAAGRDSIPGLAAERLKHVFITHLHSDHTTGLPDVIFTGWTMGRAQPLEVFGPPRTKRMVDLVEQAWADDIAIRLRGGEPSNRTGYRARVHDVKPGVVYRDTNVTVTAFAVPHGKWEHAYGYVFQTRDRKIVISGDTGPTEATVKACDGCDVLVHEVYSAEALKRRTPAWQAYHAAYHTSAYTLGDMATRARPGLLVLYHQLYWGDDDAELLREIGTRFVGRVVSGRDLGVY